MPTTLYLRVAAILFAAALTAALFAAWRANLRDQARLAADLAIAKQALAQDTSRQHDRDAQLAQTLAALAAEKRAVYTPAQILRALPNQIPLPTPITMSAPSPATESEKTPCSSGLSWSGKGPTCGPEDSKSAVISNQSKTGAQPTAAIPTADLKPLYDFALDCKACQAKLATAQADLTDERSKTTTLTRERDEAVRALKGGSLLRRIAHNAKWLIIGAAAGAIAAKAHP